MLLQDQLIHHFFSSMCCWTHVNTRERRHLASFDPYPCSYGVLATLTCQAMVKRLSFALEKSTGTVDFSNALVKRLSSAFNWRGWFSNALVKRLSFAFNWRGWLFQCPDLYRYILSDSVCFSLNLSYRCRYTITKTWGIRRVGNMKCACNSCWEIKARGQICVINRWGSVSPLIMACCMCTKSIHGG